MLPKLLGKPFYARSSKTPIPVSFEGAENSQPRLKNELKKALESTYVYLSPSASTSVRVALSSFTPEMVAENVDAVVTALVEKKVPAGWRGVRSLHIKSPDSAALPIWMTTELYEQADVLKPEDIQRRALKEAQKEEKRSTRKAAKKEKRKAYLKSKTLPAAEEKDEVRKVEEVKVRKSKSTEKLVNREVEGKKKRKSLGEVVDSGLDASVKEAKKLKKSKL